jgi:hypothetical protein
MNILADITYLEDYFAKRNNATWQGAVQALTDIINTGIATFAPAPTAPAPPATPNAVPAGATLSSHAIAQLKLPSINWGALLPILVQLLGQVMSGAA